MAEEVRRFKNAKDNGKRENESCTKVEEKIKCELS
jgi:hypothetical protein